MKKILIIEDNREIRENTTELLELNGFMAIQAENGRVGFTLARQERPDLILCDIMMPETNGTQFLKLAKGDAEVCLIPVIFFSAGSPSDETLNKIGKKVNGLLLKPFSEEQLLNVVKQVMVQDHRA